MNELPNRTTEKPTFDEWFFAKYGTSFEELYEQPFMSRDEAARALSRHTREYVSDMVRP